MKRLFLLLILPLGVLLYKALNPVPLNEGRVTEAALPQQKTAAEGSEHGEKKQDRKSSQDYPQVLKTIRHQSSCILNRTCVDSKIKESEFSSPRYTEEHEKLRQALLDQRLLVEKGEASQLTAEEVSDLLKIDNEEIRQEVFALIHLDPKYESSLINFLRTQNKVYINKGNFNELITLNDLVRNTKAKEAYLQLVKEFIAEKSIPLKTYAYKLNEVSGNQKEKRELFKLACSRHDLDQENLQTMKRLYALNRIDEYENDCHI